MSKNFKKSGAPTKAGSPGAKKPGALSLWPIFAAVAIVVGAVTLLFLHVHQTGEAPQPAASVFMGDHYPSQGHQGHMPGDIKRFANFGYNSDPPTSGFHREIFSPAFVSAVPLPKYVQVHLLEHGNVLLQYNCPCPQIAQQLAEIAVDFDSRLLPPGTVQPTPKQIQGIEEGGLAVVVAPYPTMTHTIALTAWTRLATMPAVNKADVVSFINQWLHDQDNLSQ